MAIFGHFWWAFLVLGALSLAWIVVLLHCAMTLRDSEKETVSDNGTVLLTPRFGDIGRRLCLAWTGFIGFSAIALWSAYSP